MSAAVLLKGMVKRSVIEMTRYSFELLSALLVFYLFFLIIFFGAQALLGSSAPAAGGTLSAILVGYIVWTTAILSFFQTSQDVTQEATAGTFEQLALSPFGLRVVLTTRFVAGLGFTFFVMSVLLTLAMATSGRWMHIDVLSLVPLFLLTLAGVYGLGIGLAGLALVFKRVQSFMQIVQFLFIAVVAVPIDTMPAFKYLPLAWGNELIGRVMIDGSSIIRLPAGDLLFLFANTGAWLALGLFVFGRLERVARDRALLGHY